MSNQSFIEPMKVTVTMEHTLNHYGLLVRFQRDGDNLSGPCPLHHGSNPTEFRVNMIKNVWNCFGECKHGGDVLDFIAIFENITRRAAAEKITQWFKVS